MALLIKQRLLQERSHPLKTRFGLMQSSKVARKHRSATACLPVNRNASRYNGFISFAKFSQSSAHVAYPLCSNASCFGGNLNMITSLGACHIRASGVLLLGFFLTSRPRFDSFDTI